MKFNTLPRRVAVTGAVSALAAGALVGLTTTAAHANPVSVAYTCPTALGNLPVSLVTDIPNLALVAAAGPYAAGSPVAANAVPGGVTNTFTISQATKDALASVGTSSIDFTSVEGTFGNTTVPADLPDVAIPGGLNDNGNGTWSFDADATNLPFNNPSAGTFDIFAPATISFTAMTTNFGPVPVTCTADSAPAGYGHPVTIIKNNSTTKGTSLTVPHGTKASLKAKVTAPNHVPTGKVVFKQGTTKLGSATLNSKGIAVLKKTLSKGKHKITASYGGDGYTNTSKSAVFTITQK